MKIDNFDLAAAKENISMNTFKIVIIGGFCNPMNILGCSYVFSF